MEQNRLANEWLLDRMQKCTNIRMEFRKSWAAGSNSRSRCHVLFTYQYNAREFRWYVNFPRLKWVKRLIAETDPTILFFWLYREYVQRDCGVFSEQTGKLDSTYYWQPSWRVDGDSILNNRRFRDTEKKTGLEPAKILELWGADKAVLEQYRIIQVTNAMLGI
jgi:hypothetical protein